jgi:hypothetical protein
MNIHSDIAVAIALGTACRTGPLAIAKAKSIMDIATDRTLCRQLRCVQSMFIWPVETLEGSHNESHRSTNESFQVALWP